VAQDRERGECRRTERRHRDAAQSQPLVR
jgi:hypothetical protein